MLWSSPVPMQTPPSQLVNGMHALHYKFLMKPKESAGSHQTLSARVGSGDKTTSGGAPTIVQVVINVTSNPVT